MRLTQPPRDTRPTLQLAGMDHARVAPGQRTASGALSCAARLGRMVDRARTARDTRRLPTRLPQAKLRQTACSANLDYRHPRGFDQAFIPRLATCQGGLAPPKVVSTGPTGLGQPGRGGALGHKAGRAGGTALSLRLPRCLQARPSANGEGR